MKKTLTIILLFAAVLAALLGVSALTERLRPEPEQTAEAAPEPKETPVIANILDETGATAIRFEDGAVSVTGQGAIASDGVVTIAYPGTYRLSGASASGQLVVDCADYHGAVYLLMDGVSVTCNDGPALHIKQADRTVIHLAAGTENSLTDGEDYLVTEKQEQKTGAGIYSADDLVIEGQGSLTVAGGRLRVYSADDGLQGSDYVEISGGDIAVGAYGDGVKTTEGHVTVTGGTLDITSAKDGIDAITELTVTDGTISVLTYGGAENYETIALGNISAKGLKGRDVTVAGGDISLNTADDAIHGEENVLISGGSITAASGDDALRAAAVLTVSGGVIDISTSYEAMEAPCVRIQGGAVTAAAENNGVSAGESSFGDSSAADTGGFIMTGGAVTLSAPRCVKSEGMFYLERGDLYLTVTGTEEPLACREGSVTGGTVILTGPTADTAVLTEGGEIDGSLLFIVPDGLPTGTAAALSDASGDVLLSFETGAECRAILLASGALGVGQSYTLTAGEYTLEAAVGQTGEGCAIAAAPARTPAYTNTFASGGPSGGMPGAS